MGLLFTVLLPCRSFAFPKDFVTLCVLLCMSFCGSWTAFLLGPTNLHQVSPLLFRGGTAKAVGVGLKVWDFLPVLQMHWTLIAQELRLGSGPCDILLRLLAFVLLRCRTGVFVSVRFFTKLVPMKACYNSPGTSFRKFNLDLSALCTGYCLQSEASALDLAYFRLLLRLGWRSSGKGYTHVFDRWCCSLTWIFAFLTFWDGQRSFGKTPNFSGFDFDATKGYPGEGPAILGFVRYSRALWCCSLICLILHFDSTLGFEGEGPEQWILASLNVGSLEKHSSIFEHDADVFAFQETRHTAANRKKLQFDACNRDFALHLGTDMSFRESGIPTWGGVAIAAKQGCARPFLLSEDCSGHFQSFQASARVCACWVAPSQGQTMLVVSVYCFSGAPCDSDRHAANNNLFRQVFEMLAQFGNIPIAICADFQNLPHSYSSINEVIQKGLFSDPLASHSPEGIDRPYTFCKHNLWRDSDYKSSIDGILLNNTAAAYLEDARVERVMGLQHAKIVLRFQWPTTKKIGARWHPHAALDLSNLSPMNVRKQIALQLWNSSFGELCQSAEDSDALAHYANQYALQILLRSGAKWKHGVQERGTKPNIKLCNVDSPRCSTDGPAKALNLLEKTLRRINDLSFKLMQSDPSSKCKQIMNACCHRIAKVCNSLDIPFMHPPTQDALNELWSKISDHRDALAKQIRKDRISQWKKRMQGSAAGTMKDVFHYLKFKHREPTVNAMCDAENMPIHHPVDALVFANQQWTHVFEAHREGIPVRPILHAIGDSIDHHRIQCTLGPVTPEQLFQAVADRKKSASAGMDGWRTPEFQSLPVEAFVPWAILWNQIENSDWDVPSCFKLARLVIIPKPLAKTAQPIHQRLIALLCIPYLAYSKARFTASIPWQLSVFPPNVCGGVAGRKASDISHALAMANEVSLVNKEPLVGIKLDRSKCFDRIVVPIIVALGERLGLDAKYLKTWAKLYNGFERYICWHSFITDQPISGYNGIAQGDTSSVLAVNILMSAWAFVMESFSSIRSAVFVDDAYLYTEACNVETLVQAVTATQAFDALAGQQLNLNKSCIWATSGNAKRDLKRHFPDVQCEDFVEVLGGFIKANSAPRVFCSPDLFQTIKCFIHDIARLPVDFRAKTKLIASKIVPKITFAAEIRPWPRKCIEGFTSAITFALWGNRPSWRSAEILFACATDPTQCYPPSAIASCTIVNIVSRCRHDLVFFQQWVDLQHLRITKKGLLDLFLASCAIVGLIFEPPCSLRFLDFPAFHFLDLQPAALRRILRVAARQALYQSVLSSNRKDFCKNGSGILDSDLTCLPRVLKPWYNDPFPLDESYYLGALTGAIPTANRLYNAGVVNRPKCRFCNAVEENIQHLTQQCKGVSDVLGQQRCPLPDQPHWDSHGIVEVPFHLITAMKHDPPEPDFYFDIQTPNVTLWTDGSLVGGRHLFSRTMGFAVIDHFGRTVCAQGVRDMWATAFKAELTALLYAVRSAMDNTTGTLTVVSDCKSLINVARNIQQLGAVPLNLSHHQMWKEIFDKVRFNEQSRLILRWVRAHQIDKRHPQHASFDQEMNKLADNVAKSKAMQAFPLHSNYFNGAKRNLLWKRRWLVQLSKMVGERRINQNEGEDHSSRELSSPSVVDSSADVQSRFVRWPWNDNCSLYRWMMPQGTINQPKKWLFKEQWWKISMTFFQQQKWAVGDDYQMSIYEVAFHFWKSVKMVPPESGKGKPDSFLLIVRWLRMVIRECKKLRISLWPDGINYEPRKALFLSHTFPYGRFTRGRLLATNSQLAEFGRFISSLPNGGSSAASWDRPVNSIP